MSIMEVWNNVPAGSQLRVTLSPNSGFGVTGTHTVITANGPILRGAITSSHFPLEIPVGGVDQHLIEVQLLWMGADRDVKVSARVKQADGSIVEPQRSETLSLDSDNRIESITLIANG